MVVQATRTQWGAAWVATPIRSSSTTTSTAAVEARVQREGSGGVGGRRRD